MAPVETEFYDLLGVPTDVNDTDLKKAYRKAAMKYHPDKNSSPDAEEKFKDMSKAYSVLSDPNLRAVYDKNGSKMTESEGAVNVEDAAGFFANVFGGERFMDYIGEISLMKEMTSVATTMMTEEEKAEIEKEMNGGVTPPADEASKVHPSPSTADATAAPASSSPPPATVFGTAPPGAEPAATPVGDTPAPAGTAPASDAGTAAAHDRPGSVHVPSSDVIAHGTESGTATPTSKEEKRQSVHAKNKRPKMTPEQRAKLEEHERERKEAMEKRIKMLTTKLVDRLRPFVEAKNPGAEGDPETKAFENRMKLEADDLKLESFGVELLHTIGSVYIQKATTFLKSQKFLGIPGFWSKIKEKGSVAKEAWGVIGSALSVQAVMQDMERLASKGEVDEEELKAMELDMTGKIMLASWRGTRFEVVQVLREVVDNVLKEHGVSQQVLQNRAKGLLLLGAVFKSTVPDESDEERRELERMVAEAAKPKRKAKPRHSDGHKTPVGRPSSPPVATNA
ncbi:DnaJ-domain-containing protein [Peniophora sp. CONT]|nr:DnaJ-domain-containing protein [Peniophora sp. CONT]